MNDIITNGTEIKRRIISEIQKSSQNIYLAMAWFTDRDIASSIIHAKNKGIHVEIILSSNIQNETVKQMFKDANINVHAFETGDERGMMHHKFCLIDNRICINGSYNYSYNASNNNVENIHVSDDPNTYQQLLSEFNRLKYNIEHQIDVNLNTLNSMSKIIATPEKIAHRIDVGDSFNQHLFNLVYTTANIDANGFRRQGYDNSKESGGNIEIFKANLGTIKEEIKTFAADDSLTSKKNVIIQNVNSAYESKKSEIESAKERELINVTRDNDLVLSQLKVKTGALNLAKIILESGNKETGEKGLLQINGELDKKKNEKRNLESSFKIIKFWNLESILFIFLLIVAFFYLSIFFASAIYKVLFEGNIIRASLEAGITPSLPKLVDANAIVKIFRNQGVLFGLFSSVFFIFPLLISNLKVIGGHKKLVNIIGFWIGILIFDIIVAVVVALNVDEIKSLLIGEDPNLKIWNVWEQGEFWLIFVFGMLPMFTTHYLIDSIRESYRKSKREIVDVEKNIQIQLLEQDLLDLSIEKEVLLSRVYSIEGSLKEKSDESQQLERNLNNKINEIEKKYLELLNEIKIILDSFVSKITSGKIFTGEILNSVSSAYKSGFIEYLPELYSEKEVTNRVKTIEQALINNY